MTDLQEMGQAARIAARQIAGLTAARKNAVIAAVASALESQAEAVLAENALDIAQARARGMSEAMLDRLLLTASRIAGIAADARHVIDLPDPVGEEIESRVLSNGIRLSKRRVPIGVIGVIYEARPNVTIDVAMLCLKAGNAVILRGGSETLRSNLALVRVVQAALRQEGLPPAVVQSIDDPDRALVTSLLRLDRYVDMIIPRGGAALHHLCREQSTIPVITGGIGICHVYVDESADLARAVDIVENAKVQRPSVCNALDTLLVHRSVAPVFLPMAVERLAGSKVAIRADDEAFAILAADPRGAHVTAAGPGDFDTEWLALILGVKVVDGVGEAIGHIVEHGTGHSDSILTRDPANAARFVDEVDSSAVYVNASTRFTDGAQFGLGAEVAVSTQKVHARGPMGLAELTSYKWIGIGDGQIRE